MPFNINSVLGLRAFKPDMTLGSATKAVAKDDKVISEKEWQQMESEAKKKGVNPEVVKKAAEKEGFTFQEPRSIGSVAQGTLGAIGTAGATLAGAAAGGEALKKVGKSIYGLTIPPNVAEARRVQNYQAGKSSFKPRTVVDTAIESPMFQKGGKTASSKVGMMGTKSGVGVQAAARANSIFKDTIEPLFKQADDMGISIKYQDLLDDAIEQVKNSPAYSDQRKADIIEDIMAFGDEFVGETNLKNLHKNASDISLKMPKKFVNQPGKVQAASVNDARKALSSAFKGKLHSIMSETFDADTARMFQDYSNFQTLAEQGVSAQTQAGLKGGFGKFMGSLSEVATPVTTTVGKTTYKVGDAIQAIPRTIWQKVRKGGPKVKKALGKGIKGGAIPSIIASVIIGENMPDVQAFQAMQMASKYQKNPEKFIQLKGGPFEAISKTEYEANKDKDGNIVVGGFLYDKDGNLLGQMN